MTALSIHQSIKLATPGAAIFFFNGDDNAGPMVKVVQDNEGCHDVVNAYFWFEAPLDGSLTVTVDTGPFPRCVGFKNGNASVRTFMDRLEIMVLDAVLDELPNDEKPILRLLPGPPLEAPEVENDEI